MSAQNPTKLSEPQRDLLALFERTDLPDQDWIEIRRLIGRFLATRATHEADRVAQERGWTAEDFERMARAHNRA